MSERERATVAARLEDRMTHLSGLNDTVSERMAALVILGPRNVSKAYEDLIDAMAPPEEMNLDEVNRAESALTDAMRKALRITDYSR